MNFKFWKSNEEMPKNEKAPIGITELEKNIKDGTNINEDMVEELCDMERYDMIVNNLDKFKGLNHKELVDRMINSGTEEDFFQGQLVGHNLDKFEGLDSDDAFRLVELGESHSVVEHLDKFEGLDLDELADKLTNSRDCSALAENLEKFPGLDHHEIALKIIALGRGDQVAKNINNFQGIDRKDMMARILDSQEKEEGSFSMADAVGDNLDKFDNLDSDDAFRLIDVGQGFSAAKNIKQFKGLDHKEFAIALIEAGDSYALAKNLENFEGLDHQDIAMRMIDAGKGKEVAKHLDKFQGLDHKEIMTRILSDDDELQKEW